MKLRPGTPEAVGMSAERIGHVANLAESWVASGVTPALRNTINLRWIFPFNLITLSTAVCSMIATFWILRHQFAASLPESVVVANLIMLWVMGMMSVFWVRKDLGNLRYFGLVRLVLTAAIIAGLQIWASSEAHALEVVIAFLGSLAAAFIGFWYFAPEFVLNVREALFPGLRDDRHSR